MSSSAILLQFLNGLAGAASLFLMAAGLSLIFGVSRIVNFAHGSLYMLGMYAAVSLSPVVGFWAAVPLAVAAVALAGALMEMGLLRRIYRAPELLQLLATFAVLLLVQDFALWMWGPQDLLGPRAPGFVGAVSFAGGAFPTYDLLLIVVGPAVFALLQLALTKTRWGVLVRAATQDREMAAALGVNQRRLFTGVFALGAALAALGGALAIPREPASLAVDLAVVSDAFVVVVIGGLGSIPGAFIAALVLGEVKAFCIGLGYSKITLVIEFIVMALVLVARPWGLLGRDIGEPRAAVPEAPLAPFPLSWLAWVAIALVLAPLVASDYTLVLLIDILVFALFAVSLQFMMGHGGMLSFGHAAYFGLGAYGAGLAVLRLGLPMELSLAVAPLAALAGGILFGWFSVRLSGVYLAMLTLAFAQIVWSLAFQWDTLTGGSNGLVGIWPASWLASRTGYYYLTLTVCGAAIAILWHTLYSPYGYALRAVRDSRLRAEAIGIDARTIQWAGFAAAALFAGLAGGVYAFSKGSISPESLSVTRSVDGLVMVLLGGVQTVTGAAWGAGLFTWLEDSASREFAYWRAALGAAIMLLVLVLPRGIGGLFKR